MIDARETFLDVAAKAMRCEPAAFARLVPAADAMLKASNVYHLPGPRPIRTYRVLVNLAVVGLCVSTIRIERKE